MSNSVMHLLNITVQLQHLMKLLCSWSKKTSKQYVPRKHKEFWIKCTSNMMLKDMYTTWEYVVKGRTH